LRRGEVNSARYGAVGWGCGWGWTVGATDALDDNVFDVVFVRVGELIPGDALQSERAGHLFEST